MALNGSQIIARVLKRMGVDDFFYIMGETGLRSGAHTRAGQ